MPNLAVLCALVVGAAGANPPVVLLNGLGGAALQCQLDATHVPKHALCTKKEDWFTIWLDLEELVPGAFSCFEDNIIPRYNASTQAYSSPQGVSIRALDFGGVGGLAYLDPSVRIPSAAYFEALIEALRSRANYSVGVDLFGAPFDWRFAPDGLDGAGYFGALKELIEGLGAPATLVTHSMGGPVALEFLNQMTAGWKAAHVRSFVPISPPFGGAVSTAKSMISGDNLGAPVPQATFRNVQAACASGPWLFPQPQLWAPGEALVTAGGGDGGGGGGGGSSGGGGGTYGSADYARMFEDLGLDQARDIYAAVKERTLAAFNPPLVPTYVMHGSAVDTATSYVYEKPFERGKLPDPPSQTVNGDGDGTVNIRSLKRAAATWTPANNGGMAVQHFDFPNASHFGALKDERVLAQLLALLA